MSHVKKIVTEFELLLSRVYKAFKFYVYLRDNRHQQYMIWRYRDILEHMKTWLSSKSLVPKFVDSSCKQYTIGGVSRHVQSKKSYKKNRQNLQRFFNYIKSLYINYIFCAKMFGYSKIIYCLQIESTCFVTKDFELNQVFICLKMSRYAQVIYYYTH